MSFDQEVAPILNSIGSILVEESDAKAHFDYSLRLQLLGSWVHSEGPGKRTVLTFITPERYLIIHEDADEANSQPAGSVEAGAYEWDRVTGAFSVEHVKDSDGRGGLWHESSTVKAAKLSGNTLTLTFQDSEAEYEAAFTQVADPHTPLVGAWFLLEDNNAHVLTFLSDSEYVIAHTNNQQAYASEVPLDLSGEFGSYQLQADGRFQAFNASVDTDGPGGLYNRETPTDQAEKNLTLQPWGDLGLVGADNSLSFARIGGLPVTLRESDPGRILAVRAIYPEIRDDLLNALTGKTVRIAPDSFATYQFTFSALDETTGRGTVIAGEQSGTWSVNSSGTVMLDLKDLGLELTLIPLLGHTEYRILFAAELDSEPTIWDTVLQFVD